MLLGGCFGAFFLLLLLSRVSANFFWVIFRAKPSKAGNSLPASSKRPSRPKPKGNGQPKPGPGGPWPTGARWRVPVPVTRPPDDHDDELIKPRLRHGTRFVAFFAGCGYVTGHRRAQWPYFCPWNPVRFLHIAAVTAERLALSKAPRPGCGGSYEGKHAVRSLLRSWPARSLRVLYALLFYVFCAVFTYPLCAFFTPIRHHVFYRAFNAFF